MEKRSWWATHTKPAWEKTPEEERRDIIAAIPILVAVLVGIALLYLNEFGII